ncbi:TetR/AcrR family transcriptional regulator [Mesorhizobium sp. RP14(2022)]|uniref:TetR/AcrR family transcriptional regulator n=1 Tax=Mesorhizobium liriopis TaxID=2953882 RepID=A0ABT1C5P6_9HYPH|nr:TetR/AcrR family transcriptional regulator [Mesorhizobium liriopis]MCO6050144.1 TetR/AcrR family transcriptional regulator [Mesorhizobium liriopis]
MEKPSIADLLPRKNPVQLRSRERYNRILIAARQVLAENGAFHFTIDAVADQANISTGSIYQYFPNSAALTLALQQQEWLRVNRTTESFLGDETLPALVRLRGLIVTLFRDESELPYRLALHDSEPLYRHSLHLIAFTAFQEDRMTRLLRSLLPKENYAELSPVGSAIWRAIDCSSVDVAKTSKSGLEIDRAADALSDVIEFHIHYRASI